MEHGADMGKPVRDTFLSYGRQCIDDEDIEYVIKALKSDYLTTGPMVEEFEQIVANYVGAKYAIAVNSGTAALHVALFGCGIRPGDEVIVTPMTFAASANAILYLGAIPVFADVDEDTYNISVQEIKKKITPKTKAIIGVDFAGQPVDIDEINALAKYHGLKVIEDGAHSIGSTYKGQKVGALVDATTFSFHPVKTITTAEGGMIITNDKSIYTAMKDFRSHGILRDKDRLLDQSQGGWYYEQQSLGYNYRLTDVQSALGISQMNKIDKFIQRRREIVSKYNEVFKDIKEIITPYEKEDRCSGHHIYVIRLNKKYCKFNRKQVFEALLKENIGVNVHYIPVYYHPYYQKLGYEKGICPIAERLYETSITIPLFPTMTNKDVDDVIVAVKKVLQA